MVQPADVHDVPSDHVPRSERSRMTDVFRQNGASIARTHTQTRTEELEPIRWTKARELAKVAPRDRQGFDCAPWVHKANTMPRKEFKREVDHYLTGKDTEPWEILY